jgi:hypothetical protein
MVSLAREIASSSEENVTTGAMGPNTSVSRIGSSRLTSAEHGGLEEEPCPVGALSGRR